MTSFKVGVHKSNKQVQVLTTGVFQKEFGMNPDGREVQERERENDPVACPLLLRTLQPAHHCSPHACGSRGWYK